MKEEILKLREQGKSYREIQVILGCSKSLISYHCGEGQKEKNRNRTKRYREDQVISQRVERFQYNRKLKDKSEDFQRPTQKCSKSKLGKREINFTWKDVIAKFGWETTCYLTGRSIDLHESKTYQFDHITPKSKGGTNDLENLGIACREANIAKSNMTKEEFLQLCKETLEHNGFVVSLS